MLDYLVLKGGDSRTLNNPEQPKITQWVIWVSATVVAQGCRDGRYTLIILMCSIIDTHWRYT